MAGPLPKTSGQGPMKATFLRFLRHEDGATMIEYALIIAFIGIGVIASVSGVGTIVKGMFQHILDSYKSVQL
jgi:pilus assembly protein Flp/PilA